MSTKMYRKTTCLGCGFTQETTATYEADRKQWRANHTLETCREAKAVMAYGQNPEALMSVVRDSVDL
jgi:hypothetical protein